jgi:hypothetical protein
LLGPYGDAGQKRTVIHSGSLSGRVERQPLGGGALRTVLCPRISMRAPGARRVRVKDSP